jgi:hypothetical protein
MTIIIMSPTNMGPKGLRLDVEVRNAPYYASIAKVLSKRAPPQHGQSVVKSVGPRPNMINPVK